MRLTKYNLLEKEIQNRKRKRTSSEISDEDISKKKEACCS